MSFQAGAFQGDAFQIPALPYRPAGGFDSESYAYAYNNADRMRRRVESLPPAVLEVAEEVIAIESPADRGIYLASKVSAENKFLRLYLAILEDYRRAMIEEGLAIELAAMRRREDDELCLILLLSE